MTRVAIRPWALSLVACLGLGAAAGAADPDPVALRKEIDSLRAPKVAWRGIAWKSCLLDGLKSAKTEGKPVLLWVFIDRPADDARC